VRAWSRSRKEEEAGCQGGEALAGATRPAWLLVVLCCCCSWTQRQILVAATTDANDGGEPESRLFFLRFLHYGYSLFLRSALTLMDSAFLLCAFHCLAGRCHLSWMHHQQLFFPVLLCSRDLNPVPLGVQKQAFLRSDFGRFALPNQSATFVCPSTACL
jgi:hypothetical protein